MGVAQGRQRLRRLVLDTEKVAVPVPIERWLLFSSACVVLVATPGPNVVYLVSRTIAGGRAAGFVSLAGTFCGSGLHVIAAALGLSAVLLAVPVAYEAMRWAGAAYLAWLAYATWRSREGTGAATGPGGSGASHAALLRQGFLTGVLNPKVALFELALFPQFVSPERGGVLAQSLLLGATQLAIALAGDSLYVFAAAGARRWILGRRAWARISKRVLASVFALLAVRLAWDRGATR